MAYLASGMVIMSKIEIKHGDNYSSISVDPYRVIKEEKFRYILDSVRMNIEGKSMNDIDYGLWNSQFKKELVQVIDRTYYDPSRVMNGNYLGIVFHDANYIPERLVKVISERYIGYITSAPYGFYGVVAERYDDSDFIALRDEDKLRMMEDFHKYD
jgi:hypothetical protein